MIGGTWNECQTCAGSEAGEENQSRRAESGDDYLWVCHREQIFTFTICVSSFIQFKKKKKALFLENIFLGALIAVCKETKKTREE